MRSEHTLGWYSLRGTAFVSLDIVEDSVALAGVINHETTHHIVAASTPFGYVQQALDSYLDNPFASEARNLIRQCRDALFTASRLPQEAAATYCGLANLEGEALEASVSRLPPFYKYAYGKLEGILPRNAFPPLDRVRAARAIVCRALQTPILQDWTHLGLHQVDSLSAYLENARNSPEGRLELILNGLSGLDPDQRIRWAGRHIQDGGNIRLMPPEPGKDFDLEFFDVPFSDELEAELRRIITTFSVVADEVELRPAGAFEIAIQPAVFSTKNLHPIEIDDTECPDVDFIMVDRNIHDVPLPTGDFEIPPSHARLLFYRPDSRVPVQTVAPIEDIPALLEAADPQRQATVCVTEQSVIPIASYEGQKSHKSETGYVLSDLQEWTGGREVLLYTMGQKQGLLLGTLLLETSCGPVQNHAMLMGEDWGLVLFRSAADAGPTLVHPVLLSEWERQLPPLSSVCAIDINVESVSFFRGNTKNVIPALQFARSFMGMMFTDENWKEYCNEVASALTTAPQFFIEPLITGTEFGHDDTHR